MPFNVRIARHEDAVKPQGGQRREHGASTLADGLASFASGVLFGFGMLAVLIVSLWIADAAGVALPPEVSALLDGLAIPPGSGRL